MGLTATLKAKNARLNKLEREFCSIVEENALIFKDLELRDETIVKIQKENRVMKSHLSDLKLAFDKLQTRCLRDQLRHASFYAEHVYIKSKQHNLQEAVENIPTGHRAATVYDQNKR
jgi:hypothetical protein